jgi:2',5'-phosphodiesterase
VAASGEGLEAAAAALRRREAGLEAAAARLSAAAAGAAARGAAPAELAAACAGVPLSHELTLRSAYGLHAQPTHATRHYCNALDWIVHDSERLRLRAVAPIPPREALVRSVGLPSREFPSDHVSLCCDLEWVER